jgi:membrane-bound lytic murein transglycosylase D
MKVKIKFMTVISALIIMAGCSTTAIKEEQVNDKCSQDSVVFISELDSLYTMVDSLSVTNALLLDKIDSLKTELDYYNTLPFADKNFQIPKSYTFAGYEIDLTNSRVLQKFEKIFKAELRYAHRYIPRTGEYFQYFDKVLKSYGIPEDLKYLAVAESYLNPDATSSAKAAGIWQFMPKTGKLYGLKQNNYIDERRDVFKSTDAAARLLRDNYNDLMNEGVDDWLLAMCAYNAGMGNVLKDIREQGANNFFQLIMRVEETDFYVYRAIAIKMITQYQKELFGENFALEKPLEEKYKEVPLAMKGYHEIKDWAKAQGTTVADIYQNNPWIKISKQKRSKYTPINKIILPPGNFNVLIPKECAPVDSLIVKVSEKLMKQTTSPLDYYIVKRGDSLGKIAKKFGMTIRELKDLNRLDGDNIIPRQKLVISKKYAQELEEKEERKSAAVADSSKSNSENGNGSVISDSNYYIVKSGDTLRKIAEMFNLNIDMLKAANNLKSDNIMADQRLLVKITSFTYKVRKGESLKKIADKFDTTIKKIKADNNLTSNDLLIGQKLKIVM